MKPPYREPFFRFLGLCTRLAPVKPSSHETEIIFRYDLESEEVRPKKRSHGCDLSAIGEDDLRLLDTRYALPVEAYRKRLQAGHIGVCARKAGAVAGYNWACFDSAYRMFGTPEERILFPLEKDTAFVYDLSVFPGHRGQGIATDLKRSLHRMLREKGIRFAVSVVDHRNIDSVRIAMRCGGRPVGFEHFYRIGPWQKWFFGTREEAKRLREWCLQWEEAT